MVDIHLPILHANVCLFKSFSCSLVESLLDVWRMEKNRASARSTSGGVKPWPGKKIFLISVMRVQVTFDLKDILTTLICTSFCVIHIQTKQMDRANLLDAVQSTVTLCAAHYVHALKKDFSLNSILCTTIRKRAALLGYTAMWPARFPCFSV